MKKTIGWVSVLAAGLWLGGCAGSRESMVGDSDVGRLSSNQLGPIDRAQRELDRAKQGEAKASLALDAAKSQVAMATPGLKVADADIESAKAALATAQDSGDPNRIQSAQHQLRLGETFKKSQRAKIDYLAREQTLREDQVAAAKERIDLATARLEQSKFFALQQAGNPAAHKYKAGIFETAVNYRTEDVATADGKVTKDRQATRSAFDAWQAVRHNYAEQQGLIPARGGEPAVEPQPPPQSPDRTVPATP